MAAPRRQRLTAQQRRDQLMNAAVVVLDEVGFAHATADVIARRAGVSKGLLWHYFTDLDELFELTARHVLATLSAHVGESIDLAAPVPVLVRAAVHSAANLRHTHGLQRRAIGEIIVNLRNADGSLRLGLDDLEPLYTAQEGIFRRGQDEGDLRAELDPRVLAVTYQGAVDAMLGYLDAHPKVDGDAYADRLADVLLGGMAQPRRTRRARSQEPPSKLTAL